MAQQPANPLAMIDAFGPHLAFSSGQRLDRGVTPDRLVKTHCCFCGQQCGIQLKVKDNEVIGFEPWEEFPFNRGMLCPKGREALSARLASRSAAARLSARSIVGQRLQLDSITKKRFESVAENLQRIQSAARHLVGGRAQRRKSDHRKDVLNGQVCPRVLEDCQY